MILRSFSRVVICFPIRTSSRFNYCPTPNLSCSSYMFQMIRNDFIGIRLGGIASIRLLFVY